ncbi:hypothetical protein [Actinomadura sp. 6N118]|uniref:hypothetical protein n=1 Tax=Actinomadura sp. 6N118 TaxID=3375151 RepID=UPI00379003BB
MLRDKVPQALQAAHQRALEAHLGLGVKTNEAYGLIWLAQHEELVARLRYLERARVFKPKGARYELVIIGNVVVYPWRYGDGTRVPLEYARMRLSDVRRALLALAETEAPEQLALESAEVPDDELNTDRAQARADLRELAASVRVVFVAYASNPRAGILNIEWGDPARADDDGHLTWTYHEALPVAAEPEAGDAPGDAGGMPAIPPRPVGPAGGAGSASRRFDDAPLLEPDLSSKSPLTEVDSEQQKTKPTETGTDEQN